MEIREARSDEFEALGKLMVSVYASLEGFPDPVRQHRVGFRRIRHHAEHAQIRQAIGQVLIETVGHGQQIHGANTSDLGAGRGNERERHYSKQQGGDRLHGRYHNMRSSGRREARAARRLRYH